MLLPELIEYIFSLCSSKDRSLLCQVSKDWYITALSISRRLSSLSYDDIYNDFVLYESGDYHLIVRSKIPYYNMYHICKIGNIDIVQLMVSNGVFRQSNTLLDVNGIQRPGRPSSLSSTIVLDDGLCGACTGGHLELAKLMISYGANDRNTGLRGACGGGHLELTNLMISYGANDWNGGLYLACVGGYLELANLMISHGASDRNWGLEGACKGGHLEIAQLMISHGANNWNNGLIYACIEGHLELVKLMISKGATNLDIGLSLARRCKRTGIVNLLTNM